MGKVWFQLSVSLDGYSAGPNQSRDDPIGVGGMRLFEWHFALELEQIRVVEAPGVTHVKYRVVGPPR